MDSEKSLSNQPYLPILSKLSSQITWLTFSILIIIGTNTFLLYRFHFGALNAYIERASYNETHQDSLVNLAKAYRPEITSDEIEEIKRRVAERRTDYREFDKQSRVITLPILGIPLFDRDFFVLYLMLGVIFLLWLFTLLKYSGNFLENLLNEYHYPPDADANTIQSLFFQIMPGNYTSKRYGYYELVFVFFIASIALLVLSDLYDIFIRVPPLTGIPLYKDPSFKYLTAHLIVSYGIAVSCLVVSMLLYRHALTTLRHIRNTLILLRWNRTAFFPVLYEFAKGKNKPLGEKRNFIEYRVCDDSNYPKLVILLTHKNEETNEIKAAVDLPSSIRQFYKLHKTSKTEYDEELKRLLTIEESFMRDYFRKILRDKFYEPELHNETSKVK